MSDTSLPEIREKQLRLDARRGADRRHLFLVGAVASLAFIVALCQCAGGLLTPAGESAILGGELTLCDVVSSVFFPPGIIACSGSEALLKAGLDRVTASAAPPSTAAAGGGAPTSSSSSSGAPAVAATHPLLYDTGRKGYMLFHRHKQIGWGPKAVAIGLHTEPLQSYLDGVALSLRDGGG
jgi:hypothetical protein